MRLVIESFLHREICHYASPERRITSLYNQVFDEPAGQTTRISLPGDGWRSIFRRSRLLRRALRLDKCNVVPIGQDLVIIRQGKVYLYEAAAGRLVETLRLKNCRNVLHQSISVVDERLVYFGEYGANPQRLPVPVYRSPDGGRSWETIFEFPAGKVKHVHGCYWDPYEQKIWVFTGDFDGECYLLAADLDFKNIEWIGDGGQTFRACRAFFKPDSVHWIMDSQLEDSYHVVLERATRQVEKRTRFPGPVWYSKYLDDGIYLAATAQEIGPGVHDNKAHLLASTDLAKWQEVGTFAHDGWPKRYFKFGVIGFADGPQTSKEFYLFFEALRGLDGQTALCRLDGLTSTP